MRKWVYRIIRNTLALLGILVVIEETFSYVGEEIGYAPTPQVEDAIDNSQVAILLPLMLPVLGFVEAFKIVERIKKKIKDLVREADRQTWHRAHEPRSA